MSIPSTPRRTQHVTLEVVYRADELDAPDTWDWSAAVGANVIVIDSDEPQDVPDTAPEGHSLYQATDREGRTLTYSAPTLTDAARKAVRLGADNVRPAAAPDGSTYALAGGTVTYWPADAEPVMVAKTTDEIAHDLDEDRFGPQDADLLPEHNNDLGDWCAYSGTSHPGGACPQGCAAATPDDDPEPTGHDDRCTLYAYGIAAENAADAGEPTDDLPATVAEYLTTGTTSCLCGSPSTWANQWVWLGRIVRNAVTNRP